jgi:deoxyguanosine kinase
MLICIEGCIGVGKTTLVRILSNQLVCHPLYEEYKNNPFLSDFYQDYTNYAPHVQFTFMFLQDRRIRQADEFLSQYELVISDFHPIKSMIFSQLMLSEDYNRIALQLHNRLVARQPQADLIVYLRADPEIILGRVKKRDDLFTKYINLASIVSLSSQYDDFFKSYLGKVLTFDTSYLDYEVHPDHIMNILGPIGNTLDISRYLKVKRSE